MGLGSIGIRSSGQGLVLCMNLNRSNRFVLFHAVIPTVLISFTINFLLSLGTFGRMESVAAWGAEGLGTELVITSFLLPFITSLILFPVTRLAYRKGKVDRVDVFFPIASVLPQNMFGASLVVGLIVVSLFGSSIATLIGLSDAAEYLPSSAIAVKTGFATLLALIVSTIVGYLALGQLEQV